MQCHPTPAAATAPASDPDLYDAAHDAACALSGIADALACRTATDPDDLLEMLSLAASAQAAALRSALR